MSSFFPFAVSYSSLSLVRSELLCYVGGHLLPPPNSSLKKIMEIIYVQKKKKCSAAPQIGRFKRGCFLLLVPSTSLLLSPYNMHLRICKFSGLVQSCLRFSLYFPNPNSSLCMCCKSFFVCHSTQKPDPKKH